MKNLSLTFPGSHFYRQACKGSPSLLVSFLTSLRGTAGFMKASRYVHIWGISLEAIDVKETVNPSSSLSQLTDGGFF